MLENYFSRLMAEIFSAGPVLGWENFDWTVRNTHPHTRLQTHAHMLLRCWQQVGLKVLPTVFRWL